MKYKCYECNKKGIYTEVEEKNRFIDKNGKILCTECAKKAESCNDKIRFICDITSDLNKCFYYFQKTNLKIKSKVTDFQSESNEIKIKFQNGELSVLKENQIKKVSRPSNIIEKFTWCYAIKNTDEDLIGYIGKKEE